jgi:hypothetical protein
MLEGQFICGKLLGYQETPWPTDPTKLNRRIGVLTGTYKDSFGVEHVNSELIDIQYAESAIIQNQCASLVGKHVIVPVITVAKKGGKDGAWLSKFMPKGACITEQKK